MIMFDEQPVPDTTGDDLDGDRLKRFFARGPKTIP